MKDYIKEVTDITKTVRDVNDLNIAIRGFEHSAFEIEKENRSLKNQIELKNEEIKGLKNIFLGGEGLFLTKLTGPGKVILQTQNFNDFAGRVISMIPNK